MHSRLMALELQLEKRMEQSGEILAVAISLQEFVSKSVDNV